MEILVTGSTGFIGAGLCRALIEAGHHVRAFHRTTSSLRLLADLPVEHITGDLLHPETMADAMSGVQVVFHTAALMGAVRQDPGRFYAVTVEGTRAVLEAARQAGVERLVHTSSVAALGVPARLPARWAQPALMDERNTWNYRKDFWPYGYAKYLAEMEVQKAVAAGLDAVIVNPSVVLGAGDIYRQSRSIVVQIARRRLSVSVEGGLNIVHIQDVVSGHLAAMQRGKTGERYILSGDNLLIAKFLQRIAAVVGVPAPSVVLPAGLVRRLARPYRLLEGLLPLAVDSSQFHLAGNHFYYDNTKARLDLGWENRFTVDQAIQDAYDWFRGEGAL